MKKAISGSIITFTFEGEASVVFDASRAHADTMSAAMMHGFSQRIGDNAAIPKSADNNWTITEAMRREAVLELVTHYESGTEAWNIPGTGRKLVQNAVILQLATTAGISYEAMQAKLAAMDIAAITAL